MSVTAKDNGARALLGRIARARPRVKVGIFGEAAAAKANDSPSATVGQIAAAHEYGLGVPRRSWMNDTITANEANIREGLRRAARAVLDAPKGKQASVELKLLAQVGQHVAGLMRQRIAAAISPALSPAYLKRKLARYPGATTPLIASGQMYAAIGAQVEGSAIAQAAARASARKAAKKALARRRRIAKLNKAARSLTRVGKRATKAVRAQAKAITRRARKFGKARRASKAATRYLSRSRAAEVRRVVRALKRPK